MNPWKPIETAPIDGTPILVGYWHPNKHWNQTTKTFDARPSDWVATVVYLQPTHYGAAWNLVETGSHAEDDEVSFTPTHWTEIPTPPQQPQ